MREFFTSKVGRVIAWVTTVTTTMMIIPPGAFAAKRTPDEYGDVAPGKYQKLTPKLRAKVDANARKASAQPDVRALTSTEMRSAFGRGEYRNRYLCGVAPWQRDFHGMNTSTGNLFYSMNDIQVKPARGAGLTLQRTYNSLEDRVGPFGVGWTQAYDMRCQEAAANSEDDEDNDTALEVDFMGTGRKWQRDADGLYTPPPHCKALMNSDYNTVLENGPTDVAADTVTESDGTTKHYIKDGDERLCDYIEDRHGNRTTLTYGYTATMSDGSTKTLLTSVTDPSGRTLTFTWTDLAPATHVWRITEVQGPRYRVTYEYYTSGGTARLYNLYRVHLDPDGLNRTTTYDYTSVTGSNGTEYGLLSSVTDPAGHVTSYGYALPTINPTGCVWVSSITEPAGVDSNNNQRTITWNVEPFVGEQNIYGWSTAMLVCHITGPSNLINLQVISDQNLRQTAYYLAEIGNPVYQCSYDTDYNVTTRVTVHYGNNNGTIISLPASPAPMRVTRTDAYTFGLQGKVLTHSVNGTTVETNTYYDETKYFGTATSTDALGRVSAWDYYTDSDTSLGNRGELAWARDARYSQTGRQYGYTYNSYGQKATETNLNNVVTRYTYADSYGNLTQVIQDYGTGKLNRTTNMVYDTAGNVTAKTDPNGWQSTMGYNTLGQLTSAYYPAANGQPAETISYTYGSNGRVESMTDNRGSTGIGYEAGSDRVSGVTDPVTGTISYTYNVYGSVLTKTLPGGGTWTYAYGSACDALPKDDPNSATLILTSATDDQGRVVEYQSDMTGQLHTVKFNQTFDGNGVLQSYCRFDTVWDGVSEPATFGGYPTSWFLTRMVRNTWHWKDAQGNWQSSLLSQNDYTYNNAGVRLSNAITDNNGITRTEEYGYDELYRLTDVDYDDGETQSYTFDPMGNRLTKGSENYTYNNANMLLTRGASTYTNDANGNTLTGGGRTNTWDSQNRLRQCVCGGTTSVYTYGADGIRRRSVVGGVTTDFVTEGGSMIRERRGGSNIATYFMGLYKRDDMSGTLRWYVYDGLGSVLGEVASDGTITVSRKYDVYGAVRSGGAGISKQKFVGQLGHTSDDESGLIYMQARYMDPVTGRFISEDPAQDGANWFVYCGDNPTSELDLEGRFSIYGAAAAIAWFIYLTVAFIRGDMQNAKNDLRYMCGMVATFLNYLGASPTAKENFIANEMRAIARNAESLGHMPYTATMTAFYTGYALTLLYVDEWCSDFE